MKATHLQIVQGTPFRFRVTVQQRNEAGALEPMPLTNSLIRLQARPHVKSEEKLIDLSSEGGGITLDEETGVFLIEMTSEQTAALNWKQLNGAGRPVYQCEIVPQEGDVIRILDGTLSLSPRVIR